MRTSRRNRALWALLACLPAAPAQAETTDAALPLAASPFQVTRWHATAPAGLPLADWDLADIAHAPAATGFEGHSSALALDDTTGPAAPAAYGPVPEMSPAAAAPPPLDPSGHVPREYATHRGFLRQAGSIKTELAIMSGYVLVQGVPKLFKETVPFHFKDEGWFGKDTQNVGMDKLTHAFNTYLIAEILHHRIHRATGGSEGDALTAGILAAGLMALNEISDAIEPDSGYSMQDITMNLAGAGFSVLRNTVPGLKDKLAFKLELIPNDQVYSRVGKKHYAQQRFMFSLKGAGFETLENSPLRYLDLQVGYYATDFLNSDRAEGVIPKRHLFVGVGLNLGELLFSRSHSVIGRAAYSVLDYIQVPYTSLRYDTTGRFGN